MLIYQDDRIWSSITVNKYPRHIQLIEIGNIFVEINIQNLFVLIISKKYQVDRNWSHINLISNTYQVDKYPRHINLINVQHISS